ncbi:hypothetical protein BD413DRAFT_136871 [Trametes elegans]|nr:hypothetical protein BD413DRAFT_136871 [Trametes elegans]
MRGTRRGFGYSTNSGHTAGRRFNEARRTCLAAGGPHGSPPPCRISLPVRVLSLQGRRGRRGAMRHTSVGRWRAAACPPQPPAECRQCGGVIALRMCGGEGAAWEGLDGRGRRVVCCGYGCDAALAQGADPGAVGCRARIAQHTNTAGESSG